MFSWHSGVAMAFPITDTVANVITVIDLMDTKPVIYKKYVNDWISCIPIDKIQQTLEKFKTDKNNS